ncbi:MAG: YqjF family protein [Bacteroidia bacterium]
MGIGALLKETSHRQFPLPEGKWQSYQEWHNVVMLHWRAPVHAIAALLPNGLTLDTFEGEAWVSWLGFSVKGIRYRGMPPLPFFSGLEEVNLRTYVICDGRPGIYLFSVEADRFLTLLLARLITGIPYVKSAIRRKPGLIGLANGIHHFNARVNFGYTEPITDKTALECWLTERHCLYVKEAAKLFRYDIHHKEWKLTGVIVSAGSLRYKVGGLTFGKKSPDKKHFAKKLKVLVWKRTEVTA